MNIYAIIRVYIYIRSIVIHVYIYTHIYTHRMEASLKNSLLEPSGVVLKEAPRVGRHLPKRRSPSEIQGFRV